MYDIAQLLLALIFNVCNFIQEGLTVLIIISKSVTRDQGSNSLMPKTVPKAGKVWLVVKPSSAMCCIQPAICLLQNRCVLFYGGFSLHGWSFM